MSSYGGAGARMAASHTCQQMSPLTEQQLPKVPPSAPPVPAGSPVPVPNYTPVAPRPQGISRWLTVQVGAREGPRPSQLSHCDVILLTLKTVQRAASGVRDPQTGASVCAHVPPGHTEAVFLENEPPMPCHTVPSGSKCPC